MGIKDVTRRIVGKGSVALATAGLSTCLDNGAVDPAPQPIACGVIEDGRNLSAAGTLEGTTLTIEVTTDDVGGDCGFSWGGVTVTELEGATLTSVVDPTDPTAPAIVTLELEPGASSGAFTFRASFGDPCEDVSCDAVRRFTFVTENGMLVQIASADGHRLPLCARHPASIAVVRKDQGELELCATTSFRGRHHALWNATGGQVEKIDQGRVVWRLPAEKGYYQIEVALDYGSAGLAFDALTVEVA